MAQPKKQRPMRGVAVQEEEDARELKFGEEFKEAKCLSISEVQVSVPAHAQCDVPISACVRGASIAPQSMRCWARMCP